MQKYLGVKIIQAVPMSEYDFVGEHKGADELEKVRADRDNSHGYKVVYEDGYSSWSPKMVFEKAYRPTDNLTFGLAIEALKQGKRVARLGWNGEGMYLYLTKGTEVWQARDNALDEIIQKNGVAVINPHIDMKAANDTFVIGWLASQTDMLSEDWVVLD